MQRYDRPTILLWSRLAFVSFFGESFQRQLSSSPELAVICLIEAAAAPAHFLLSSVVYIQSLYYYYYFIVVIIIIVYMYICWASKHF